MSSIRTDRVALDTNEFIYAIRREQPDSVILVRERLPLIHLFIPLHVQLELQRNLTPAEMSEFFDLVAGARQLDWGYATVSRESVAQFELLGAKKGDAAICAELHAAGVNWLVSDNRHFLREIDGLPFTVLNAASAVAELS